MKKILIFFFAAFTLVVNAQNKKRKKVVPKTTTEVVTDTIKETQPIIAPPSEEQPKNTVKPVQEGIKRTQVIPIGTNVFVQLVFKSIVQVVRSGAPDMAMVRNEDNVVTIQALAAGVNSNISVKTADGLYYSYKIVSSDENDDIPLFP